jgi:hypothetical protein
VRYSSGWPRICKLVKRSTATLIFWQGMRVVARGGQVVDFDGGELRVESKDAACWCWAWIGKEI